MYRLSYVFPKFNHAKNGNIFRHQPTLTIIVCAHIPECEELGL